MININKITLTLQQVAGADTILITGVRPMKEFQDGKQTDKVIGYNYSVVCPANKYEAFSIKIEQEKPTITQEELDAKGGTAKAKVKAFEGKFYQNKSKDILFTAKATGIEIIA